MATGMHLCQSAPCMSRATIDERDKDGHILRRYCDDCAWKEVQRRIAMVRKFVLTGTALPFAKVAAVRESYGKGPS